jgi:hypothetical protein
MVRHHGGPFEGAAVLEIGRDPGRPERVIADFRLDARRRGAPSDYRIGVRLGQGGRRQLLGAAADRPE